MEHYDASKTRLRLPSIEQIERTVNVLDTGARLPFVPIRFPLDPIVGIVPCIGDFLTLFISGAIIGHSRKFGVPKRVQSKMVLNIVADCIFGCVPIIGDVFDFFYKANRKNLMLLKRFADLASKEGVGAEWTSN